VVPRNMLSKQ